MEVIEGGETNSNLIVPEARTGSIVVDLFWGVYQTEQNFSQQAQNRLLYRLERLETKMGQLLEPLVSLGDKFFENLKEKPEPGYTYPTSRRNRIISACLTGVLSSCGTTLASALIINAIDTHYNLLAIPIGVAVGVSTGIYVSHLEKVYERTGKAPEVQSLT